MLKWKFDITSLSDGLNDSLILTFKGNLLQSLARESIQNSIDAHDGSLNEPVIVKFKLHNMHRQDIPGLSDLSDYFKLGKMYVEHTTNVNESFVKYYNNSIDDLKQPLIPVLEVSDYNTIGLTGDSDTNGSGFFNLVIAEGDTSGDNSRGGSFGIGKGALFNASKIRCLYFSSKSADSGVKFIGKVKMSSFIDKENNRRRGTGILGLESGKETSSLDEIPEVFRRKENGLSVFISNFKESNTWQDDIKKRVLNDFWLTILEKRLVVIVDDNLTIDHSNVEQLIKETFDSELPDSPSHGGRNESPLPGLLAVQKGKKFDMQLSKVGKCRLYLINNPEFASIISHFRKPKMLIYKRAYRSATSVQGVFICDDDIGNIILRATENPEHLEWRSKNVDESSDLSKKEVLEALTEIQNTIDEKIEQYTGYEGKGTIDLDIDWDMGDFGTEKEGDLFEMSDRGKADDDESFGSAVTRETQVLDKIKPAHKSKIPTVVSAKNVGGGKTKSKGRGTAKGVPGGGDKRTSIEINFRSFVISENDKNYHLILFKDKIERNIDIELWGATDSSQDKLDISEVDGDTLGVKGNTISGISTKRNRKLKVLFEDNLKHPLILQAYISKDGGKA